MRERELYEARLDDTRLNPDSVPVIERRLRRIVETTRMPSLRMPSCFDTILFRA